jgi:hypothetical protein
VKFLRKLSDNFRQLFVFNGTTAAIIKRNKTHQDVPVAIDFSGKILVTNPTAFHLGRSIVFIGVIPIGIGVISYFAGDILMPAMGWFAVAAPTVVIGAILVACGLTKP